MVILGGLGKASTWGKAYDEREERHCSALSLENYLLESLLLLMSPYKKWAASFAIAPTLLSVTTWSLVRKIYASWNFLLGILNQNVKTKSFIKNRTITTKLQSSKTPYFAMWVRSWVCRSTKDERNIAEWTEQISN